MARGADLRALKHGAALAVVLAASGLPAYGQTSSEAAAGPAVVADEDPQQSRTLEEREDAKRERIYVLGQRVNSGSALPEDPIQIVNVIDGETLAQQGVSTLEQALRNVPGITTQIGEGGVMSGDQFFIRGLSAKNDIYTDGLRDFGVFTRDSFNYGQIEVYKGPSASAFGRGAAGGGINTASKAPFPETAGAATMAVGSGEYYRATGDWNQDLGDGIAVRVAAMAHRNENTGRDHVYSERWGIAPTIGFGLDGDTSVTVGYFHQDEEKVPDYGIPVINGVPATEYGVDPTNYYGFNTDIDETMVDTVTVRARHKVNDWLSLTNDTKWGYYQRYSQYSPTGCNTACATALTDGDPLTVPMANVGGPGPYEQDTTGVQNITTAQVTAPIGSLRNELLIGADVSWQHNDRNGFGSYASRETAKDLFNPELGPDPVRGDLSNVRETTGKDVSLFLSDRLWFTDQWSVTLGLRQGWYEVDQRTTTTTVTPNTSVQISSNTDFLTPQVGVVFEPTPSQMYYVSYSSSAKPPGVSVSNADTINDDTSRLDPEENTNIELGARLGLMGDRLQLQGAVFKTEKKNAKLFDVGGDLLDTSGDSQEITGVEIGVGGAITDQWSINAGYTFLDTEITESETAANIGKAIQFTPEQSATLWTTYNFLGALNGLEIGGGLTYQGEVYLNAANDRSTPSYTTLDGLVSYAFDRFRISLNAYNLTDEVYFAQVHGNRVTPGQGRTFIASLGVVY